MTDSPRVLIVDDQPDFAKGLVRLLAPKLPEASLSCVLSGEAALADLAGAPCDVMVTDLRMPGLTGLDLLPKALALAPNLGIVLVTAHGDIDSAVLALKAGAYDFLTKPVDSDHLARVIAKGLERAALLRENRRLRAAVAACGAESGLLGQSPAVRHIKDTIAAVAASDYTVLIRGESGTGKELAARAIHAQSRRAGGPFLSVNCPAIPDQILESELFGHVRGAFTGAERDRRGLFVAANGGILVLDEIGDIPMSVQTKLLRVLQEREVRPVGSSKSIPVDVRILASTNQDLEARILDKTFREDLYYRLNVLTLRLPPLRDRRDDIPLLATAFLERACREMGIGDKEFSPEGLAALAGRDWPGNVRELFNFVRRLTVFSHSDVISQAAVAAADSDSGNGTEPRDDDAPAAPYLEAKAHVVDAFTRRYVERLLGQTRGNISEAARLSGLERVSLQKILRRLGIAAEGFR
ncbi:sigma-54 dependent transcriptional regulator/response regulator [Desulfovibrio sp. DV]|uniref:sigma-54-dependent transcriptional regulator n=1 Tax=Desulfovibrio sp. DV TaxID=1844708 RepID=UPI00094BBA19|nr:sigma-54 dependent transcriptional regulator [Desulfovibrio sp. DV]OLN25764.1 sigma-54 dependent transcriptional regulator/response regulator [Desulfovibrio sp. DV]